MRCTLLSAGRSNSLPRRETILLAGAEIFTRSRGIINDNLNWYARRSVSSFQFFFSNFFLPSTTIFLVYEESASCRTDKQMMVNASGKRVVGKRCSFLKTKDPRTCRASLTSSGGWEFSMTLGSFHGVGVCVLCGARSRDFFLFHEI